jgi:type I restriction enzyme R subunit
MEQGNVEQLKANEPKRVELYKAVAAVTRAYANLANEMPDAGYSPAEAEAIRKEIAHYVDVRAEVKLGAGEDVDFKQYEAGMRFLLDTYIQAGASEVVSNFEDTGLVDLIVKLGAGAIDKLPQGIKKDPEAVAETIVNNMRKVIIDERAMNPKYYDKMSELLDAIIEKRRQDALDYQQYLAELLEAAKQLGSKESDTKYPAWADNGAKRALIDYFFPDEHLAVEVDTIVRHTKPDSWVGNPMKERLVRNAIKRTLPEDFDHLDELFELVKARHEYR